MGCFPHSICTQQCWFRVNSLIECLLNQYEKEHFGMAALVMIYQIPNNNIVPEV